jgi:hypothetical protein
MYDLTDSFLKKIIPKSKNIKRTVMATTKIIPKKSLLDIKLQCIRRVIRRVLGRYRTSWLKVVTNVPVMLLPVLVGKAGTGVPSSFVVVIILTICSVKYERETGQQAEEQEVHVPTLVNGSAVRDEEKKEVPTLANAEVPTLADVPPSAEAAATSAIIGQVVGVQPTSQEVGTVVCYENTCAHIFV